MTPARRARGLRRLAIVALACVAAFAQAHAAPASPVAAKSCAALKGRVDAVAGKGALFLRSYDGEGASQAQEPALKTAAFVYDQALAVIALSACDALPQASRVGEALRLAANTDTRLRNAYRAGPVGEKVLRNGWWDAAQQRWVEDGYQAGTATGNVAWAALALLALHQATHEAKWLDAARSLGRWVVAGQSDTRGAGGFRGGVNGFDEAPVPLDWKSTEHALDLVALFDWLAAIDRGGGWDKPASAARTFLATQWDERDGRFAIGTGVDGVQPNLQTSALDVQLWSQLVPRAEPRWKRALAYAERTHAVDCGFDFDADRDGIWLEGTAQAALAYRVRGERAAADRRLACIAREFAPGGYVYATREPRITTGLAADAYYFRLPHLGATAWAALAALGRNPYVPAR
ncbi:hypothetical protein [Dokdonella ginsengisoli]|uniref:Methylaspartate ammonia-lyase n=1 Tax=Dokdonella ginsengisoli TaxID=363846 RepID=A0ABV9QV16_9GAMM